MSVSVVAAPATRIEPKTSSFFTTRPSAAAVVFGFAIRAVLGLGLGIAMSPSERVENVKPLFLAFAQIPTLGWIPLLMLLVGIDETLKISVIAKGAFVPMTLNAFTSIRNIPANYLEVGRELRFSRGQELRLIVLPGANAFTTRWCRRCLARLRQPFPSAVRIPVGASVGVRLLHGACDPKRRLGSRQALQQVARYHRPLPL